MDEVRNGLSPSKHFTYYIFAMNTCIIQGSKDLTEMFIVVMMLLIIIIIIIVIIIIIIIICSVH